MAKLRGIAFVVLATAVVGCESPTAPTPTITPPPVVVTPPSDFVGRVLTPLDAENGRRGNDRPVGGVTVTIVAGPRSGDDVETDHDGRYTFSKFDGDEIHIRLEKDEYETKEAVVSRSKATTLEDGRPLGYAGGNTPGTVLIGLEWPMRIRGVLRDMPIVPDVLLTVGNHPEYNFYNRGVVEVRNLTNLTNMRVLAHELCHAHQHYTVSPRGSGGIDSGASEATEEGKAYLRAREADWGDPEIGKAQYDRDKWTATPIEGAAETCARWWDVDKRKIHYSRAWLQENAPNRTVWAEEWLTKP